MTEDTKFTPIWYTIPEFADWKPYSMYHKENDATEIPKETRRNLHVLARTHICAEKGCILHITADDYYKLYVNGRFITQGPAPAYPEHYYYNEIDLSPYLTEGDNVIAVHLYYQGLINRVWNSGDGRFGIAAQVKMNEHESCESSEGKTTERCRDLTWKYQISQAYSGETVGYETQFLENFDSNLWDEAWNRKEFDDTSWEYMVPAAKADYSFEKQPTRMLDCYRMEPKKIRKEGNSWFIDMGQEITGALRITAAGEKDSRITIRCGEELCEDGDVRWEMRCNCAYEEVWTLNGKTCILEPYDYKGFRYARITAEEGAEILKAEAVVRHYPMNDALCTLSSSDRNLEAVFEICKNGVKYGTQEGYMDCPTREKGQYLGDSIVIANSQVWLTGETDMLRKCITQFAHTSVICPGMMAVAPGAMMQEIGDFSLLWSELLLEDYRFTGDKEFLKSMYPTAKGILEHFKRYAREDGLLDQVSDKWNLVDWPENLRDDYDFTLSRPVVASGVHNVINALYIGATKTLSEIETILGLTQTVCRETLEMLKTAYRRAFYRPETGLLADSETSSHCAVHSNFYALYFDLVPMEMKERICDFLIKKGFCCGVFASYFILKGLARNGRHEDVYRLLVNETEHGWINMIREGATTCFEAWGKEQKWNTSLCHPWASAPVAVLIECIAGFVPDLETENGFVFEPHIPKEIGSFEMKIPFQGKVYRVRKDGETSVFEEIKIHCL